MVESQPNVLRTVDFDRSVEGESDYVTYCACDFELLGGNQRFWSNIAANVDVNGIVGGKLFFASIQESELGEGSTLVLVHQLCGEHVTPTEGHPNADNLW